MYYIIVNRQPVNQYYNFMCCALFWCNTSCISFKYDRNRNPATWGIYLGKIPQVFMLTRL